MSKESRAGDAMTFFKYNTWLAVDLDEENRFPDPKNICLDTKITIISEFAQKLYRFLNYPVILPAIGFLVCTPNGFGYYNTRDIN